MKKSVSILLFVIFLSAGTLVAQKQFYFGLAGTGLNSWITNQNNYGYTNMDEKVKIGGSGNAIIGFDFNQHIGLKMEIGYANLGQKYSDKINEDTTYNRIVNLNYLQIPLMFKYRTGGEVVKFFVMAGPQINLLLSANQKYTGQETFDTDSLYNPKDHKPYLISEQTITDRYTSLDIMARIDLGVDINITKSLFLNVGLTMAYGLLDINAENWRIEDTSGNYNPSHNLYGGINFGISYILPVGKTN
jgi:hypothetical protein